MAIEFQTLLAELANNHSQTISWRRHLHQHPELPNREKETAAYIRRVLEEIGFAPADITDSLAGYGVLAQLTGMGTDPENAGRAILLRADIDALPVKEESGLPFASQAVDADYPGGPFPVAHACGHDAHTAMLLGAARFLFDHRADFSGTVYFAFQPAEEGAPVGEDGGAHPMLAEPVFSRLAPQPQAAFGIHVVPAPKGYIHFAKGVQHASSERIKIRVLGEQVHGSSPWLGKDPMPAAADIISAMGQLYRQVDAQDAFTVTIGHVEDTGRFNIVGQEVTLWGTARCLKDGLMEDVNSKIERTAHHIAQAYGCTAEVEFDQFIPPVVNKAETVEEFLPALVAAAGSAQRVLPAPATMGYDDMSEFIQRYGGMYALLGVQDAAYAADGSLVPQDGGRGFYANHSPHFYVDEDSLEVGVRMHTLVALKHLGAVSLPSSS